MKHLRHHLKTINKKNIKKTITTLVLLFFAMTMLFQKEQSQTELQFVWTMNEEFLHNAPNTQRDYLFQDESGQDTYQWTLETNNDIQASDSNTLTNSNESNVLTNSDEIENLLYELQNGTGNIYTGTIMTWTETQTTDTVKTWSLDCITPWGEIIKNNDFVLAYEQRKDVNVICNVQKRVCMSGNLDGSFTQKSCRDDIVYEYKKAEIISYNQKILNEYIQPTPPINSWATFDTKGKINGTEQPTDTRATSNSPVTTNKEVSQIAQPYKKGCTTPRNQKINHGQFVKAYKTTRGFIDMPCEVELRACINGTLKGSFRYSKCTTYNTTYDEYLTAGSPSSNTGFLFFERIKSILRR